MQIILILSLLHAENEAMAYIDINVKETPFSVTVLLSCNFYWTVLFTFQVNIQGSMETYVVLWNNHMHALIMPPYVSVVNNGSLVSILFTNL